MKSTSFVFVASLSLMTLPVIAADTSTPGNANPAETAPAAGSPAATPKQDIADQSGFSKGSVVRSIFTSAVKDREPTDDLKNSDAERVFYFTELRDMNGQTATHRWEHEGKVVSEVKFNVNNNRWRVWSSKTFMPSTAGDWKVSVLNGAGDVISEESIKIDAAGAASKATEPATNVQTAPAKSTP